MVADRQSGKTLGKIAHMSEDSEESEKGFVRKGKRITRKRANAWDTTAHMT